MSAKPEESSVRSEESANAAAPSGAPRPRCGIVMPISAIDGCSEGHWRDVRAILEDAIRSAGFEPNLVSEGHDAGVIHKRIVQNLYENELILCDVSARNPNVMLELGMRLAFDKPAVLVKDDITPYNFDTHQIEHISYPRDLRFPLVTLFGAKLRQKLASTYDLAASGKHTTFLRHFGQFEVAKVETKEVSELALISSELRALRHLVQHAPAPKPGFSLSSESNGSCDFEVSIDASEHEMEVRDVLALINLQTGVDRSELQRVTRSTMRVGVWVDPGIEVERVMSSVHSAIESEMPQYSGRIHIG